MKKTMKIIVPILLVLLIIASVLWYGFVYDRNFTRDLLLKQARNFSTTGNSALASWFYDLAYEYTGQDENVAIELANQFKSAGNYTKAEYTLSNAIADGGTVELYIALCKTYVEQDKLLDAVTMLDNVSDPEIKAQLDAQRPAAPTADPAPGFYNQYIPVTLTGEGGTLYYTTGDEYPSTDDIPYSEPFTLSGGETTVYAVSVAANGLVSPLSIMGFTVGGVIEPVYFDDAVIETAVREILGVDGEDTLYSNQLWTITEFTVPADASIITDLTKLPYLESLTVNGQTLESLQFLSSLTSLTELDLSESRFPAADLSYVASLPSLQYLTLADCSLSTVAGLENAQSVTHLDLSNNTIRNLEPLTSMINLHEINLQHNALTGLTALSSLTNLEKLDVSYNSLTSIAPLATCMKLSWLDASNNALTNLGAINNLPALTNLWVNENDLTDADILATCLTLTELGIANNDITDISALSTLVNLETFDFSYNDISALPDWPAESVLRTIDGSYNQLTDISGLGKLQELTHVYMDYNQITSVSALADCYKLTLVNIYGNEVESVSELTDHDIIVNYDPT